jgi:hypothetical protein
MGVALFLLDHYTSQYSNDNILTIQVTTSTMLNYKFLILNNINSLR